MQNIPVNVPNSIFIGDRYISTALSEFIWFHSSHNIFCPFETESKICQIFFVSFNICKIFCQFRVEFW